MKPTQTITVIIYPFEYPRGLARVFNNEDVALDYIRDLRRDGIRYRVIDFI